MARSQIENSPVHSNRVARPNQQSCQALKSRVIANIDQSTRLKHAFQDPRHVPVEKGLRAFVCEQEHGTGYVLAHCRQGLKLFARSGKSGGPPDHLSGERLQCNRSSAPKADRLESTLQEFCRRRVNVVPAHKKVEKRLE